MLIDTNDYVDTNKAAEMLGVTEARIRALCKSGRFPGMIYIGKKKLIPISDIQGHKRLKPGVKTDNKTFVANILEQIKESEKKLQKESD